MTRRACVVTTSTLCALAAGSFSASAAVAGSRWTGGGPGAVTVVSDGSTTDRELRYVARRKLTGSWWLRTTPPRTEADDRLRLRNRHADLLVAAPLESFVTHDGETQIKNLASGRALVCCARSGGLRFRGTAALDVKAGDAYGFLMSGSNLDIGRLAGALRLTLGNRPPALAAPQLRVRSGDFLAFALNASDPDGDEVAFSIVIRRRTAR